MANLMPQMCGVGAQPSFSYDQRTCATEETLSSGFVALENVDLASRAGGQTAAGTYCTETLRHPGLATAFETPFAHSRLAPVAESHALSRTTNAISIAHHGSSGAASGSPTVDPPAQVF